MTTQLRRSWLKSKRIYDWNTKIVWKSQSEKDCFRSSEIIVIPDKFQSVIINRFGKLKNSFKLLIDNHKIDLESSLTQLGNEIDIKLNFEKHVTALCQKASRQ